MQCEAAYGLGRGAVEGSQSFVVSSGGEMGGTCMGAEV